MCGGGAIRSSRDRSSRDRIWREVKRGECSPAGRSAVQRWSRDDPRAPQSVAFGRVVDDRSAIDRRVRRRRVSVITVTHTTDNRRVMDDDGTTTDNDRRRMSADGCLTTDDTA